MSYISDFNSSGKIKVSNPVSRRSVKDPYFVKAQKLSLMEMRKRPLRTEVINHVLSLAEGETTYLEIGVRNPDDNFNHINADKKYSVDPGVEFEANPVDFKTTSDDFFDKLSNSEVLSAEIRFDVIFIDGLHLADQVNRDIINALKYIKDEGFIILHDCNPPTEWHARMEYDYHLSPAGRFWNGTTWKAFLKWRFNPHLHSCCIDSDWGVGVLSKNIQIGQSIKPTNQFFEFNELDKNRTELLNLLPFEEFKKLAKK